MTEKRRARDNNIGKPDGEIVVPETLRNKERADVAAPTALPAAYECPQCRTQLTNADKNCWKCGRTDLRRVE